MNEKMGFFRHEFLKLTRLDRLFMREFRFSEILSFFTNENEQLKKVFKVIFNKLTSKMILQFTNEKQFRQLRPQL